MLPCENSIIPIKNINYCCDTNDIKQLNESKRYTIIASGVITEICQDTRLIASSVKLWHYLYVKASLNPKLEITISYNELSKDLNKSLRTICRYVSTLKRYGYLLIKNNYNKNGQTINTFFIRIPKSIVHRVKETKDRNKNIKTMIKEDSDFVISSELQHVNNVTDKIAEAAEDNKENEINVESILIEDNSINNSSKSILDSLNNTQMNRDEIIKIYESLRRESSIESTQEVMKMNQRANDKFDVPRYDKFGSRITTTVNSLLNNSAQSKSNTTLDLVNIQNRAVIFKNVQENIRHVNLKHKNKIIQKLITFGFREDESLNIAEEIVFAIKHDSLREKSIDHAINIALKLVKSRRWTTPCKMRKH